MPHLFARRLLAAAAIGLAFIANAAGENLAPQARSGGSGIKEGCSSAPGGSSGSAASDGSANLSDQLAQSNGVICPPARCRSQNGRASSPGRRHACHSAAGLARRRSEHYS
jgi:hypothetical protein